MVAVAERQHGRISTAQLTALGVSRHVVAERVASGWLVREHRGAYRLAGAAPHGIGRCVAAVLAVDPRAGATTHRTALERHGILPELLGAPVHVTTARCRRPREGIVIHCLPLEASEVVRIDGLRVASPLRALLDTAGTDAPEVVADAVREAEYLRLVDLRALAAVSDRPGAALLRGLARELLPVRGELRGELERRFAEFLRGRRFPVADVNRRFRLRSPAQLVILDAVWMEAGLAVELDGRRAHDTARAFEADRLRDRRISVQLGLQVIRVTWRQLRDEPDALGNDLAALYARGLAARRAA